MGIMEWKYVTTYYYGWKSAGYKSKCFGTYTTYQTRYQCNVIAPEEVFPLVNQKQQYFMITTLIYFAYHILYIVMENIFNRESNTATSMIIWVISWLFLIMLAKTFVAPTINKLYTFKSFPVRTVGWFLIITACIREFTPINYIDKFSSTSWQHILLLYVYYMIANFLPFRHLDVLKKEEQANDGKEETTN